MAADRLEVKGDLEHIQIRPKMYIGSVHTPDHLLQEVIDNSFDECINGFASTLTLDFVEPSHIIVTDNGRGIPIHPVTLPGDEIQESVIVACTKLFSGTKFDNDAYESRIGMHGIGLCAVNALSKFMRISVKDRNNKKKIHDYIFNHSQFVEKTIIEWDTDWSTRVEFIIDEKYFTHSAFTKNRFMTRLNLVKAKFPNINLIVDGHEIDHVSMEDFIRERLEIVDNDIPVVSMKYTDNKHSLEAWITYDPTSYATPISNGDINLRLCGGLYLTNFATQFANAVKNTLGVEATKNELLSHFRYYVSLSLPDPSFDSQAKYSSQDDITFLLHSAQNQLNAICKHQYIRDTIQNILQKKSLKKAAKKISKKKSRVTADNPLADCLNTPGNILYIMEGESADGTLKSIRDNSTEAIMPISGKIVNVVGKSIDKVVDSKKFKYILEALGVELGKKQQKFRYNKIKLLCDADPDGLHIAVLVVMGLWYFTPQLITSGNVSVILPPLYGAAKGKQFIPIYDDNEVANYRNQGFSITRFKGIGEMDSSQLEVVIRKKCVEYVITPPGDEKTADSIAQCLSDTQLKRKLCEDKIHFNLNQLLVLGGLNHGSI